MGKFNPGITLSCVEGETNFHRLVDMIIADKDMWKGSTCNEDDPNEMATLMVNFRRAAQAWERLIFASGGFLALHKC